MPPRVQEQASEGASNLKPPNVPRESEKCQNARGPEWHPDKTRERRDARPKQVTTSGGGGKNKEKETDEKGACGGVPCYYLSCLSQKKTERTTTSARKTREGEKKTQKTPDLTSREFFQDSFGNERTKNKTKHRQNSTKKHKTNTDTTKQKFAPENFSKQRPSEKKNGKKATKDTEPDTKKQNEKKRTAFPPSRRGKKESGDSTVAGHRVTILNSDPKKRRTAKNDKRHRTRHKKNTTSKKRTAFPPSRRVKTYRLSVTIRLPVLSRPLPLPGPSFMAFCWKGAGGGVNGPAQTCPKVARDSRSSPISQKWP